jgi:hypothetical protein
VNGDVWAAACAYEFEDSALACRWGDRAERGAANSTNSSALLLVAGLRQPIFLEI